MPIRKLHNFTVRRFFGAGKTPFGRLTHQYGGPYRRDRKPAERNVASAITGMRVTHLVWDAFPFLFIRLILSRTQFLLVHIRFPFSFRTWLVSDITLALCLINLLARLN